MESHCGALLKKNEVCVFFSICYFILFKDMFCTKLAGGSWLLRAWREGGIYTRPPLPLETTRATRVVRAATRHTSIPSTKEPRLVARTPFPPSMLHSHSALFNPSLSSQHLSGLVPHSLPQCRMGSRVAATCLGGKLEQVKMKDSFILQVVDQRQLVCCRVPPHFGPFLHPL